MAFLFREKSEAWTDGQTDGCNTYCGPYREDRIIRIAAQSINQSIL